METGCEPCQPESLEECLLLEEIAPRLARRMKPAPEVCEFIGLPRDYGKSADKVQPFDRLFRRRLLRTVEGAKEFAQALGENLGVVS
jgi:hypothetical protein